MQATCLPKDQKKCLEKKLPRSRIRIDPEAAASKFKTFSETQSGLSLIRICWYDGTSAGPPRQQTAIAEVPNLKIRLGHINRAGQQKGVDSLIVTDLIALARNRAMAEYVLLSGDEDLRVGVQSAQEYGVRVHLLGIKPSHGSQSSFLLQEADITHEWTRFDLKDFLSEEPTESFIPDEKSLESVARFVADSIPADRIRELVQQIAETRLRPSGY